MKLIGHWLDISDVSEKHYPDPQYLIDENWLGDEKNLLISYLTLNQNAHGYWGYSWCRFGCGVEDSKMGSHIFTDGVWAWPEGLAHYVRDHSVMLPDSFIDHCRNNSWKIPDELPNLNMSLLDETDWLDWANSEIIKT